MEKSRFDGDESGERPQVPGIGEPALEEHRPTPIEEPHTVPPTISPDKIKRIIPGKQDDPDEKPFNGWNLPIIHN